MAIYRFTVKGQCNAQEWRNVWYGSNGVDAVDGMQDVIDQIRVIYNAIATGTWSNQCNIYGVDVRDMDVEGSPTYAYSFTSGPLVGNQTGNLVPNQVAGLVGYTALTTKPNRVRKYIPGMTVASTTATGLWTAAWITTMQSFNSLVLGLDIVVPDTTFPYSVKVGPLGTAVGSNRCTASYVRDVPATQRRRRVGVGI